MDRAQVGSIGCRCIVLRLEHASVAFFTVIPYGADVIPFTVATIFTSPLLGPSSVGDFNDTRPLRRLNVGTD